MTHMPDAIIPGEPSAPAVVGTPQELGAVARARREALHQGLRDAAPAAHVGTRFLSEFERGKPTAELGKVLDALHGIGLDLAVVPRGDKPCQALSRVIGTDFPYDWSNSNMEPSVFIRKVLLSCRFPDVLKTVGYFGIERVTRELPSLGPAAPKAADVLARIYKGMLLASTTPPGGNDLSAASPHAATP